LLLSSCADPAAIPGVQVRMDFASTEPFAAPVPGEGGFRFPNPKGVSFVRELNRVLRGIEGAGTTSGVFFSLTGAPEGELPSLQASLQEDASVFLVELGGPRIPVTVEFREDGGPHGAANLLSVLPLQGRPLAPNKEHAVMIRRSVVVGVSKEMRALIEEVRPDGMSEEAYERHRRAIDALGIDPEDIAGMTAFVTTDPTTEMREALALAETLVPELGPFELTESHDDFCVFHGTADMPVLQIGEPPFANEGGEWARPLAVQRVERANVWLTIPRVNTSPLPTVVFSRTGGGGERPLIDRGMARPFARAGWAGISIDGPHGGLRNITGGDEQLLIFNFGNPIAMRDNIRQSAFELALAGMMIDQVSVTSTCATARLDAGRLALMGHSMGATIAPLAMASGLFEGLILSGAGGSWIENVIHKQSPLRVKGIAELLLQYEGSLHEHDPVLSLLQWAGESADPPVYGRHFGGAHVLMFQGIVDTYILPPIANASSLAFELSPAEPILEPSIVEMSALFGRSPVSLPANDVVIQWPEDGIEDGHEIVFTREEPKLQIECFLASLSRGTPEVCPVD
jgi:hypothetical protein